MSWIAHAASRRVFVEHAGPLTAIVVAEGAYDPAPAGDGGLGTRRCYVFTAGSPTVNMRHAVSWEGAWCDARDCDIDGDGDLEVNALSVERQRVALALDLAAPLDVLAVGAFSAPAVEATVAGGDEASVRQLLRVSRESPLAFEVTVPGSAGAAGGMLAVSGTAGTVAAALNTMHRYEPRACACGPTVSLPSISSMTRSGSARGRHCSPRWPSPRCRGAPPAPTSTSGSGRP